MILLFLIAIFEFYLFSILGGKHRLMESYEAFSDGTLLFKENVLFYLEKLKCNSS